MYDVAMVVCDVTILIHLCLLQELPYIDPLEGHRTLTREPDLLAVVDHLDEQAAVPDMNSILTVDIIAEQGATDVERLEKSASLHKKLRTTVREYEIIASL